MEIKAAFFVVCSLLTANFVHSTLISQQCLDCICYASTGCDLSKECHNAGPNAYFCGPFQASWAYWADGGKPGDAGGAHDFEKCLNNKNCAEQAVIGYMRKWQTDCNHDGHIDCIDFAAIHKAGPSNCSPKHLANSDYWKRFTTTQCYSTYGSAHSGHSQPIEDFHPTLDRKPITYTRTGVTSVVVAHQPTYVRKPDQPIYVRQPEQPIYVRQPEQPTYVRQPEQPTYVRQPVQPNYVGQPEQPSIVRQPAVARVPGLPPPGSRPISWTVYPANNSFYRPVVSVVSTTFVDSAVRPVPSNPSRPSNPGNSLVINVEEPVSDFCLSCICEASSGCDLSKQCDGSVCGPYLISWAYWADSGKPGGDYVSCVLNKKCAEKAIQGYMSKWLSDCNGDGLIDCDDFAAIHKLGSQSCEPTSLIKSKYWQGYNSCYNPSVDARLRPPNTVRTVTYNPAPVEVPQPLPQPPQPLKPVGRDFDVNRDTNTYYPNTHFFDIPDSFKPVNVHPSEDPSPAIPEQPARDPTYFRQPENDVTRRPAATTRPVEIPVRVRPNEPRPIPPPTRKPPSTFVEPLPTEFPPLRRPRINPNQNSLEVPGDCMACICEASSRCDENARCSSDPSLPEKVCGPYQITFSYWTLAGRPGYQGSGGDYENCANEKGCAEQCVRGYVNKIAKDCNGDGVIDCLDFAAMHKAGNRCGDQQFQQSQYWQDFQTCYGFNRK